jgi:glycosyltransferase involved in cell wall biosynthesis
MSGPSAQHRPVSVVQVFYVVANRGGERVAAQLARGLRSRGVATRSVGVYRSAPANADTADFDVVADRRPNLRSVVPAWFRLWRLLRRERAAAVLLHTQVAGLLAGTAALAAGVRRRIIIHHINVGVSGRFFRPIEAVAGSVGLYSDIVFVGNAIRDDIARFPSRYLRRARVITNAVEPAAPVDRDAVRARYGIDASDVALLAVGALTDQKNHEVLVRALGSVPNALLLIAGDGPLRASLEQLAAAEGARVRILGHIAPEDVLELYAAVDLFVMPSRAEGRSLALLDAVAAGLPVVLSDIGQNVEVMGDAARYCPTEDVACWTATLKELCTDDRARAELRTRCGARDLGSVEAVVDSYLALISPQG